MIDEGSVDMYKQLKNLTFVTITVLLLAACGQFDTAPVPEVIVTVTENIPSTAVVTTYTARWDRPVRR